MKPEHHFGFAHKFRCEFLEEEHSGIVHEDVRKNAFRGAPFHQLFSRIRLCKILEMRYYLHPELFRERPAYIIELVLPIADNYKVISLGCKLP